MTEVSAWNAIDASNNATPPDGWPEGQQPSSVNDCARMMMGALRREHDRIVAQIGSTAGTITTTTINATTVTGTSFIGGTIAGSSLYSSGNATVTGTLTAGVVGTGTVNAGTVNTGSVTATGAVGAGTVNAGNINTGNVAATGDISCTGHLEVFGTSDFHGHITCTDTIQTEYINVAWGVNYRSIDTGTDNIGFGSASGLDFFSNNTYQFKILSSASDERLKTDTAPPEADALAVLRQLELISYNLKASVPDEPLRPRFRIGLVAQRVQELMPEAVVIGPTEVAEGGTLPVPGLLQIDYGPLLAYTIGAIQQLAAQVEALQELAARVETLEAGRV